MEEGRFSDNSLARRHTVSDLIERYIGEVLPHKKSGEVQRYQLLRWRRILGQYRLSQLTSDRIPKARDEIATQEGRSGDGISNATLNCYHAALSHVLTYASRHYRWIDENPMRHVPKLKEPRGRVRYLSSDELERLLDACESSSNRALRSIVMIAVTTGMRRSEIMNLRWSDVDLDRGLLFLNDTKNGQRRSVPIIHDVSDLLHKRRGQSSSDRNLVFPGKRPDRAMDFKKAWASALQDASIEDFRFHDLRHTAASYLAMDGASVPELAHVLGHKSHQMAARYAHLSDSHAGEVLKRTMKKRFTYD